MTPSEKRLDFIIRHLPADESDRRGVIWGTLPVELWDMFVQVTYDHPTLIYDGGMTYAAQREDDSIVQGYVLVRYTQGETPPVYFRAQRTEFNLVRYADATR